MRADALRMEGGDDVGFRNACGLESVADTVLGAVPLDPDFPVNDVNMDKVEVDTLVLGFPAHRRHDIPVILPVEDGFVRDLGIREPDSAQRLKRIVNYAAISLYLIHRRISSTTGSNTTSRMALLRMNNFPTPSRNTDSYIATRTAKYRMRSESVSDCCSAY